MSSLILPSRRFILTGLVAAPAIIAANKLMPVKVFDMVDVYSDSDDWVLASYKQHLRPNKF